MRTTLAILAATSLVGAACQPSDLTTSGGSNHNTVTAQVMASDVSRPSGPAASTATVSGTVTFSGLMVELWNGQEWLAVTNGAGTATLNVGDGSASATLVPASEIPAGDYTKARISATNAAIDLTVNGQGFSARFGNPTLGPLEIEKTVSVAANSDGSRTFSVQFEMIRSVSLGAGSNGPVVQFDGDLGGMSAPAATAPGSVVASDVSQPTDPAGARATVSGTVTFTGLSVELWDGQQWLSLAHGAGSATINIGDGSAAATLVPVEAIPAGTYTKVRISATDAVAQLTADVNGHQFAAQVRPPAEPFVIEKDVSVTVNADGSRTFAVQLELVRTVTIVADAVTGAPTLSVTGDINGM